MGSGLRVPGLSPIIAAACGTTLLVTLACAETTVDAETAQHETSSLSAEQLASLGSRFEGELNRLYEEARSTGEHFPGGIAAFILPDSTVRAFAAGFSDMERAIPMEVDMRMPSGSIGKTYVAATALALANEGKLDLDAKISTFFSGEDWFSRLPNGPDITVRHLMGHNAGIIDHAFDSEAFQAACKNLAADPDTYLAPRQLIEFALDEEPLFPAGEGYDYTDTGYILLGLVIEQASGASFYAELRRLFLDPLGLQLTLPADRRSVPNLAQGYGHSSSELFGTSLKVVGDDGLTLHPLNEWTGGGLFNNPQDLVRWAKALYEGEAIHGDYLDELLQPGFRESDELAYGLGVSIAQTPAGAAYGHHGFFPGYNSQVIYFPDFGAAVALQINSDTTHVGDHSMTLANVVLDALAEAGLGPFPI